MSQIMGKHSFTKFILSIVLVCSVGILFGQTYLTASLNTPGDAGILSENCSGPYELVLRRGPDNDSTTFIFISGSGVAIIGTDYQFPPDAFPAEMAETDSVLVIPITVINDALIEGIESVNLEIAFATGVVGDLITLETSITDAYEVEIEYPEDTIQWCRNVPFVLLASSNAEEIYWSPAGVFLDSLGSAATVRPFDSGWYYASVGTEDCGARDSIYFELAIVDIGNPDTVFICLNDPGVTLQGSLEGLASTFTWIPSDTTLSDPNVLNPIANPTVTTTYILQSDIGVCTASDRVVVRVDSLPEDLHIDIAPEKPYYCAGEIVAIFSPSFDSLAYPDITFQWKTDPTFLTPLNLLNAALNLQDTTLYIRENINNACSSMDSILINVVPPTVPLSVTDTMLCPGEMFTVEVLADVDDPEWTPEEGLSCTKCLDPTVTVTGLPGGTLFYQFSGMILDCPVGASLTVRIPSLQPIEISGDQIVCEGEMVPLEIVNTAGLSGYDWNITNGSATLSCDNCPNPVVTITSNNAVTLFVSANTTNEAFCGAIGSITLSIGEEPMITSVLSVCENGTAIASTGHPNFTNVVWDIVGGSANLSLSCNECPNPVVTVEGPGRLRFFAEVPGSDTCRVIGLVEVTLPLKDPASIILTPTTEIAQGSQVMATLSFNPLPASVMWTVNGMALTSTATTVEFAATEEINLIEAKYINSKGCEQIDTLTFPTVPPSYMIPNAFTPNNDALNDKFRIIINGNIEILEFLIFNRWGQLVYEAPEDDLEGWDGRFKNEAAASDTYVYKARIRFPDGRTEIAKGDVALLR